MGDVLAGGQATEAGAVPNENGEQPNDSPQIGDPIQSALT
jgi:hypothetical protein